MRRLTPVLLGLMLVLFAAPVLAEPCIAPDYGGTAEMPPSCPSGYMGSLTIIDGLPPGTTLAGPAVLSEFMILQSQPGGQLGGEMSVFDGTLQWDMAGTGELEGFNRTISIPVTGEIHTAPRIPGDPVQEFQCELFSLQGFLMGDPDFDSLTILAGGANGLPSPGSTELTELPDGDFNVDSFFDVTYEIEFVGSPGGVLGGLAGSTTATERYQAGEPYLPTIDHNCLLPNNGAGTVDLPPDCPEGYIGVLTIVDGLPPGTDVSGPAVLRDFVVQDIAPGGSLGGEIQVFTATLTWDAIGSGDLAGYQRQLSLDVACETHTAPRDGGATVQAFDQAFFRLDGFMLGDPDFCELIIRAGDDNGLPSPGSCTLTEVPGGDFAVDSFFDITYEIEFTGCPGSPFDGYSGITTDTEGFRAGEPYFPPGDPVCLLPDNGLGTIDFPPDCPDGYVGMLTIAEGLPAGTTLTGEAALVNYGIVTHTQGCIFPDGILHRFPADLVWFVEGTGELTGFARNLIIPVMVSICTAPVQGRDGDQSFVQELMSIDGQIQGDPDFMDLIITAGHDFELPSPGSTTLTPLPGGDFAVDSFFDITYEIEFEGAPGSIVDGMSGITLGTHPFRAGRPWVVSAVGPVQAGLSVLYPNVPNPFNPSTVISYELPAGGARVALDIFDIRGRFVCNLVDAAQPGGLQQVTWLGTDEHGRRVGSGVYLYRLSAGRDVLIRKMAVIK